MTQETTIALDFSDPDWRTEAGGLVAALTLAGPAPVRIDLSALTRPSTLVLQALVCAVETIGRRNQPLDLVGAPQSLRSALSVLGLSGTLGEDHV